VLPAVKKPDVCCLSGLDLGGGFLQSVPELEIVLAEGGKPTGLQCVAQGKPEM
jgi:hypothetical protein